MQKINLASLVTRRPDIIGTDMDEVYVMLDVESSKYLELNKTSAAIWALLAEPTTFGDLCARLTERFDISAEQCHREVSALLTRWAEMKLVQLD